MVFASPLSNGRREGTCPVGVLPKLVRPPGVLFCLSFCCHLDPSAEVFTTIALDSIYNTHESTLSLSNHTIQVHQNPASQTKRTPNKSRSMPSTRRSVS